MRLLRNILSWPALQWGWYCRSAPLWYPLHNYLSSVCAAVCSTQNRMQSAEQSDKRWQHLTRRIAEEQHQHPFAVPGRSRRPGAGFHRLATELWQV